MKIETPTQTVEATSSHVSASDLISELAASDQFIDSRDAGMLIESAITKAAAELANKLPRETADELLHAQLMAVVGELAVFTQSTDALRYHHLTDELTRADIDDSKLGLIGFNHRLQELLRDNPTISHHELTQCLCDMHAMLYRQRWGQDRDGWNVEAEWFKSELRYTIWGMQQEIFGEQIAKMVPGVTEVEWPTDPQDDLNGIDRWVTLRGVRFPIDIKASFKAYQYAQRESACPERAVYTGVEGPRFREVFRLSDQDVAMRVPQMKHQLEQARKKYLAFRKQIGQCATDGGQMPTTPTPEED